MVSESNLPVHTCLDSLWYLGQLCKYCRQRILENQYYIFEFGSKLSLRTLLRLDFFASFLQYVTLRTETEEKLYCYVIGLRNILIRPSTRIRICSVLKIFHSGERIQQVADSQTRFAGYVWCEGESAKKKLRIQRYPDMCGRGLKTPICIVFIMAPKPPSRGWTGFF